MVIFVEMEHCKNCISLLQRVHELSNQLREEQYDKY